MAAWLEHAHEAGHGRVLLRSVRRPVCIVVPDKRQHTRNLFIPTFNSPLLLDSLVGRIVVNRTRSATY